MNPFNPSTNFYIQSGFNLKRFLTIISLIFILSYGIFNARNLLFGPSIEIFSPTKIEFETNEKTITIRGQVRNATFVSVNERPISVDMEGYFEERLLLAPSFNIIEIKAIDRFKNKTTKTIKIYLSQPNDTVASPDTSSTTDETLLTE
jgi:hypothetical protein